MKKRLLVLLLAILTVCAVVSCGKEAEKQYGEFYTEEGILQNTHITLTVDTQDLVAPVNELSYTLNETCDFYVWPVQYFPGTERIDLIEIHREGAWEEAPKNLDGALMPYERIEVTDGYEAHDVWNRSINFSKDKMRTAYLPLEAGQYRLRVKYQVYKEDADTKFPSGTGEAVAYFTVTAPAE